MTTQFLAASLTLLTPEPHVDCTKLSIQPIVHYVDVIGQRKITWDGEEISRSKFSANVQREALFARKERQHFYDLIVIHRDHENAVIAARLVNEIREAGLKFGKNCPAPVF